MTDGVNGGADGLKWPFHEQTATLRKKDMVPVFFFCFFLSHSRLLRHSVINIYLSSQLSQPVSISIFVLHQREKNRCV